ncbi:MAG: class I SAM-dependent methyltransferase [Crocinitomicaceae bacterium]|nr:class I SAM-dependent methyltransferase [Crocinitomicaceae bacterium]
MDSNEILHCIVCGHNELMPLDRYKKAHLCMCLNCNLVFSTLKPNKEEIEHLQKQVKSKDPITKDSIKRYNHILDRFESYRKNNRLLDLDCNHGEFLMMAKERGWYVYGTSDTEESFETCANKGLNMHFGSLKLENFEDNYFDIVCARNILEHITDPNEEVKKIKRIIRKKGLLYATTPNFNSYLRYRLKENYSLISYPLRLVYYSRKPFKKLFKQNGFRVLETEDPWVSISSIFVTRAKTQVPLTEKSEFNDEDKSLLGRRYRKFVKRTLGPVLSFLGLGDYLKGWFVNKK